jgi:hypothetical protein
MVRIHAPPDGPYLSPLMSRAQKIQYWIWLAFLLGSLTYFWIWWLRPEHNIGTFTFLVNLIVIAWLTLLPLYFILILSRTMIHCAVPMGSRTAGLTRCTSKSEF